MELSFSEWDRALADGTTVLAIEVPGRRAGALPRGVRAEFIGARAASAVWTRTSRRGVSLGARTSGGWVTLEALSAPARRGGDSR